MSIAYRPHPAYAAAKEVCRAWCPHDVQASSQAHLLVNALIRSGQIPAGPYVSEDDRFQAIIIPAEVKRMVEAYRRTMSGWNEE